MKKEWNLTSKILDGVKTVESRWYKSKIAPWNKVSVGDVIYFKDSGSSVSVKAIISGVEQYEISNNTQALELMTKYALCDLGTPKLSEPIKNYIKDKKYAIFVHLRDVSKIIPFDIDKKGYGMQCAWICTKSINNIKKR